MCVFLQITITFGHKKETLIKNHFTRRCMTHPVIFSLFVSFLKICVCEFRNHLRRTWDYLFSFFFFKGTVRSLCIILLFSYGDLGCTLHHACPLLFLFFLCSCLTAFHSFCFDAHFWSCFFCVFLACLLAFILFSLPLSRVLFFPLVLCLPPCARLNRRLQLLRLG